MTNNLTVVDARAGAVGNDDLFELKISIEECHNLFDLVQKSSLMEGSNDAHDNTPPSPSSATQYWISYRCFGKVIQSELFSVSDSKASTNEIPFIPSLQTFQVKREELTSYFNDKKNSTLRIHLCTEGNVIATAFVDFGSLMVSDKKVVLDALKLRNEYTFQPRAKDMEQITSRALVAVTLSLDKHSAASVGISDKQEQQQQHLQPPTPAEVQTASIPKAKEPSDKQIKKEIDDVAEEEAAKVRDQVKKETESKLCGNDENANDAQRQREEQLLEREAKLQMREEQVSKKEQQLYESLASLDKRRLEWEQSKHEEELAWQEKLRNKEAAMMGAIEERIMLNEKERLASTEKARSDYEQLERRLTKAICDVEAKDRTLKELHERHQHEYNRKLAELELKEKLVKQEMKHSVAIEVSTKSTRFVCGVAPSSALIEHFSLLSQQAKAEAALEQAVLAKKEAAAAAKKVKQAEVEMDELREKHRKTPEAMLMQQVAEIKGQLADSERRIEAVKAEKNTILQDKEKFRINVKKLVSPPQTDHA